jgi:CubicO group peptidase (beta-lactamase class C family)
MTGAADHPSTSSAPLERGNGAPAKVPGQARAAAPSLPAAPTSARRSARPLMIAVGAIGWPLLILSVVLAAALIFWVALALAMLGTAPQGKALLTLVVVLALTGGTYWLVTKYVTPKRIVRRTVGLTVAVLLLAGAVWATSSHDRALFLARDMAWGESDVFDYQKFPARPVHNAPPAFRFKRRQSPALFQTIEYKAGGKTKRGAFADFLRSTNTTSFIVIKNDQILYERYLNGYKRDSIVTSFSIAKSVTSALVGIAIDEGFIGSVDDPIVKYLPELRHHGYDRLTIRDLLLMSTGIRFRQDEDLGDLQELWPFSRDIALSYSYPNLRSLALRLPPSKQPVGVAFNYNPYYPILLGMILERTTHRPVSQYLQEKIWQPLGMEYPASWSLDSTRDGFEKMESGLNARAIDFAKFGRLFLERGNWNGRQIISARWVTESTAPDPGDHRPFLSYQDWKQAGGYYKYMWWGRPTPDGGYYYSARGHLGQLIAVFPDDRLIIVRFGRNDGGVEWDDLIETVAAKVS